MNRLHSVEGAGTSKVFGSLRLFGLSCLVVMAGTIGAPALAQTCEFTAPDPTAVTQWTTGTDKEGGGIEFTQEDSANETVTLPIISADVEGTNTESNADVCNGEGALVYTLRKDRDQVVHDADGDDEFFTLLELMDDLSTPATPAVGSTIRVGTTSAGANTLPAPATVTYAGFSTAGFHNAEPVSYTIRAQKAGGTPIDFTFTVTIRPSPHTNPDAVEAVAETANSIYVEWLGDGNDSNAVPGLEAEDTTATKYEIYLTEGTDVGNDRMMVGQMNDTATGTPRNGDDPFNPRQFYTIMGLKAGTAYTVEIRGVSGTTDYNERRSGYVVAEDPNGAQTVTTKTAVMPVTLRAVGDSNDDTDVIALVEPRVGGTAESADALRFGETFRYTVEAKDETIVSVHYLDGDSTDTADDKLSLRALANGETNVTVTATSDMTTLTGTFEVTVGFERIETAPQEVHAVSETSNSMYVEWTGDGNATGGATHYEITLMPPTGTSIPPVEDTASTRQSATITGLVANTEYTISVKGVAGEGSDRKESMSKSTTASTKAAPARVELSIDETKDILVNTLIVPSIGGDANDDEDAQRYGVTFTNQPPVASSAGVTATLEDGGNMDQADDRIRLVGKTSGEYTVTVSANTGSDPDVITLTETLNVTVTSGVASATDCSFGAIPTDTNWDGNDLVFYQGEERANARLPVFNDTNCTGTGDVTLALFKNDAVVALPEGGAYELLTRTGVDSMVTLAGPLALTGSTITYNSSGPAWGQAPVTYEIRADQTFAETNPLGTFEFTVTVLPEKLSQPTMVTAHAESMSNIYVEWTGDGDGHATGYKVSWSTMDEGRMVRGESEAISENSDSTTHTYTITGLTPGSTYEVYVRAIAPGETTSEYDDRQSDAARASTTAAQRKTKTHRYTRTAPLRVATGVTKDVRLNEFIEPSDQREASTTWTITVRSGNNQALSATHFTDGDNDITDDLVRLRGLNEDSNKIRVSIEGRSNDGSVLTSSFYVQVEDNASLIFSITEASINWDIDRESDDFEINLLDRFVSSSVYDPSATVCSDSDTTNDDVCSENLTFSMTGGQGYLEIDTDNGKITVPDGQNLDRLTAGTTLVLSVSVSDTSSGASDTMTINVDVVKGDGKPFRDTSPRNPDLVWLSPLSESAGGGSRSVRLDNKFKDADGDDLCFYITEDDSTRAEGTNTVDLADVNLSGASTCKSGYLTISMNLPSTDHTHPNFQLLGRFRTDDVSVKVAAYQRGDTPTSGNLTDPVTVRIKLVYGANSAPNIRAVAKRTGTTTYVASSSATVREGSNIELTFTADDAQPTGDVLCWSQRRNCTPCRGDEVGSATAERRKTTRTVGDVSHEYDLVVQGVVNNKTITDYEKYPNGFPIQLCATDLSGASHTLNFLVLLEDVEEAPTFKDIEDLYFLVGDYEQTIDLRTLVTDGDGTSDIVDYGANIIGSTTAFTVTEAGGIVTVTPTQEDLPNRQTTVDIEVSATDSTGLRAYKTLSVTVKNVNNPPTFANGLSAVSYSVEENSEVGTNIGTPLAASDPDAGDPIAFELSGSDMFSITKTNTGGQLKVAKAGLDFEGSTNVHTFIVTASDQFGGVATLDTTVTLTDVNEAPTKTNVAIGDQRILVGLKVCRIKASEHFTDPDTRDQDVGLLIEASSTRPGDVQVTVERNDDICLTGRAIGTTPTRITIKATDREGLSVSKRFTVTVEQNNAPKVAAGGGIPDMELQEEGRSMDIDLYQYFDDGDATYDEELEFSFTIDDENVVTGAIVRDSTLRLYGDLKGSTNVTVTATDQNNRSVSQSFNVTVIRNDPPIANTEAIDDVITRIGLTVNPIDARNAFTDEGDTFTLSVGTNNPDVATAALKYDSAGGAWINVYPHSPGTTRATLTATDTARNTATLSFSIEVGARNDAPTIVNTIDDVTVAIDESVDIDLDDVFDDEGDLDISIANEDEDIADVIYRSSSNALRVYGNSEGMTTVTVTATDNIDQSVSDKFVVTVPAPVATNAAPVIARSLDNQVITVGTPIEMSIAGVFEDPDGDVLTYTVESSDSTIATINLDGENLELTGLNPGSATFSITAADPMGLEVMGTFQGSVETAPQTVGNIANVTLQIGGDPHEMDYSKYFSDPDGDVLAYDVKIAGDAATVERDGTMLSMTPYARGATTITVTAEDPRGRSATQTFNAVVSDSELMAVAQDALAGQGRAIISSVASAIGSRVESNRSDTGIRFAEALPETEEPAVAEQSTTVSAERGMPSPVPERMEPVREPVRQPTVRSSSGVSWGEVQPTASLGQSNVRIDSFIGRNFSKVINGKGGIGSWSVWGNANEQNFEGESYDGVLSSQFLGVDVQASPAWLLGVAVSRNSGESDYSWGTATQTMETSLTSVMPYASYQPSDKTLVWGVVGVGSGDVTSTIVNHDPASSDLEMNLGMIGGRWELVRAGSLQLALRGDAAFSQMKTASGDNSLDGLSVGVNRIRAGVEGSFTTVFGNGSNLTPFGELSVRNDGGDGITGYGVDVAGGLRYSARAFNLEARGHMTATHSADSFSENGVSVMASLNPSNDGSGFSFTLTPSWGQSARMTSQVWAETVGVGPFPVGNAFQAQNGLALDASVGYGMFVDNDRYLFTPFIDFGTNRNKDLSFLLGAELTQLIKASTHVDMNFVIGRTNNGVSESESQIGVSANLQF